MLRKGMRRIMDHTAEIMEYYSNAKLEWDRLEKGFAHEKFITLRMMDRFMPEGEGCST